jgi:hypothetical protein
MVMKAGADMATTSSTWSAQEERRVMKCVVQCLSRMRGRLHVRFLGEGASVTTLSYPAGRMRTISPLAVSASCCRVPLE